MRIIACILLLMAFPAVQAVAQEVDTAPPRDEGEGPYQRLLLRGGTLIDGTGASPMGPVDIVVENNRIVEIRTVGYPGVPIRDERRPDPGDRELDVEGMYILPGGCGSRLRRPSAIVGTR